MKSKKKKIPEIGKTVTINFQQRFKNYFLQNKKKFYFVCGFVIIIFIAFGVGYNLKLQKEIKIAKDIYQIELLLAEEGEEDKSDALTVLVDDFIKNHGERKQSSFVRFLLANYYLDKKNYLKTQEILEAINIDELENTFYILTKLYSAVVYQQVGDYKKATKILEDLNFVFLEDYVLLEIVQNIFLEGDKENAKLRLNTILKDYPNSSFNNFIKEILKII